MKRIFTSLACIAVLALSGCDETMSNDELAGALIGGAVGGLTARALGGDTEWVIIGSLAGAAAGTLVARNAADGDCAYSRGDGTYYRAPCP